MRFTGPIYRSGAVLDTVRTEDTANGLEGQAANLEARQSRELGRSILRHQDAYKDAFSTVISNYGYQLQWLDDGKCAVRLTPGIVIDFPRFSFQWPAASNSDFEILARPCLTVCLNESRSKVWCRFALRDQNEKGPRRGYKYVKNFYDLLPKINDDLVTAAIGVYKDDICGALDCNIELRKVYTLKFVCGDLLYAREIFESNPESIFEAVAASDPALDSVFGLHAHPNSGYFSYDLDIGVKGLLSKVVTPTEAGFYGFCIYADAWTPTVARLSMQTIAEGIGTAASAATGSTATGSGALGFTAQLSDIFAQGV